MKEETYEKALEKHGGKLAAYHEKLHDLIDEMLGDRCSVADVIGALEAEKMYRYNEAERQAKADAMSETLGAMGALAELLRGDDGR